MHGAKRLSAQVVFIPGLEEHIFPGPWRRPYPGLVFGKATNCFSQSLAPYPNSATALLSVATGSEVYSSTMAGSHELFDLRGPARVVVTIDDGGENRGAFRAGVDSATIQALFESGDGEEPAGYL
jgi:hypothetical protein